MIKAIRPAFALIISGLFLTACAGSGFQGAVDGVTGEKSNDEAMNLSTGGPQCPNIQIAWNDVNFAQEQLEQVTPVASSNSLYGVDSSDLGSSAQSIDTALNDLAIAMSNHGCMAQNPTTDAASPTATCPHRGEMIASLQNAVSRLQARNTTGIYAGAAAKALVQVNSALSSIQDDYNQVCQ